MTTPNQPNTIIKGQHTIPPSLPALVITILFLVIAAAGAAIIGQQMPRSLMPETTLPTSAPLPHIHCANNLASDGRFVPQHRISIPRRDIDRLALALQDYAHQQGGCYSFDWPRSHRITLPESTIGQVLELTGANYSQWAAGLETATPAPGNARLHQVDLHITPARYQRLWVFVAGVAMAVIGGIMFLGSVLICFIPE